jgi:hypothetical protein
MSVCRKPPLNRVAEAATAQLIEALRETGHESSARYETNVVE